MGLCTKLPDEIDEVDIIIAGGGTAGCVVASRLADADPDMSILVIEGGTNNNVPTVQYPVLFLGNLLPTGKTNLFYKGVKEEQLADRELIVPSGGVLGGGSSTNLMMYSRAQRADFDSWNTPGWSADDMLPYLKKFETYHGPGAKEAHGYDGPIHVSGGTYRATRPESDFIKAAEKVGWPEIEDLQNLDANNGVQRAMRYISPDGKRQDVASRYLHPRLEDGKHPNLHVVVESQVVRVLFDGKRAVGVEYRPSSESHEGSTQPARSVKARKMVVVSCGALGTPPVLERSGVGDAKILERAGVPLVADVPGVGRDYEDHHLLIYPYKSSLAPEETIDAIVSGRLDAGELIQNNHDILGWNSMDITCKLRPSDTDVATLGPEFQEAWDHDFRDKPNRPIVLMSLVNAFPAEPIGIPPGQYFAVSAFTVYPYSRGHLHITGADPGDPLDFATGFFSDAKGVDVRKHIWAYKKQREIVRRMDTYRGEFAGGHPPFAAGSAAACTEAEAEGGPIAEGTPDIAYSADDDAVLERWLRQNVGTTWHSLGTCKMAPRERMGVVDSSLSVYGVEGLKIADLSVPPRNVAANTNNTALAIGEKAADIFIAELGLGKR